MDFHMQIMQQCFIAFQQNFSTDNEGALLLSVALIWVICLPILTSKYYLISSAHPIIILLYTK